MSLKKLGTVVVALNVGKLLDNEIHRLSSKPSELYLYNCQTLVYHSGKAADAVVLPDSAQGYKIQTLSGKKNSSAGKPVHLLDFGYAVYLTTMKSMAKSMRLEMP